MKETRNHGRGEFITLKEEMVCIMRKWLEGNGRGKEKLIYANRDSPRGW